MTINTINQLFDHYALRARLQPAFLTLVPLAIAASAWAQPGAKWMTAIWSLLGTAGFTFFLSTVARNRGKRIEAELWKSWGGTPTTQFLRHSGPANPVLRARWHAHLAKLLASPLPSPEEERQDPAKADAIYEAATRLLIGKTRDKKVYEFVYRENVNYGFCRNLYALRGLGICVALIGLIASVAAGWCARAAIPVDYLPWGSAVACLALLLWWIFTVRASWVRIPADNFAQHLFESCEKLAKQRKAPAKASSPD